MAGSYTALLGSIPGGGPFNHKGYPKMKALFTVLAAATAMTLAACSYPETPAPPVEQPVPEEVLVEEVVAEEVVEEVVAEEVQPLLEQAAEEVVAEEAAPE